MKLTDALIKAVKPTDKRQQVPDGGGLVLHIMPNGSKLWRYRYRFNGKASMLSLGGYPATSLKDARAARDDARALLNQGESPAQAKLEAKEMLSYSICNRFEAVALEWFNHWKIGRTERYSNDTWRRLNLDVFPLLGKKPIDRISTRLVVLMVKSIVKRGALDMAKRALQKTEQIFRYGVQHGFCESDPTVSVRPSDIIPARKIVNQTRIDLKEFPKLLRDIEAYDGHALTKYALGLIALTFVRTTELIKAEWSEIDYQAGLWRIPAERMKKATPHIVPLSRQTLALLKQVRAITGGGVYLFPSQKTEGKCMSNNTILFALYRMGYHSRMTGHGFRGVASTALNEQGYSERHIELQLSHLTGNAVQRAYDHSKHLTERAAMMQDWANYLDEQRGQGAIIKMQQA